VGGGGHKGQVLGTPTGNMGQKSVGDDSAQPEVAIKDKGS